MAEADRELRKVGLRVTPSRRAVYSVLRQSPTPLSHGEVWSQLDPDTLDRATVYRNLLALVGAGLAQRMDLGDHVWRFELADRGTGGGPRSHPHFVCTECGQVECLDDVDVRVRDPSAGPRALRDREVEVQLRGRCDECTR